MNLRSPIHATLLATTLLFGATLSAQTVPGWNLIWQDEFTQADGTAPDPTKWGYDIGGWGWGNQELQYYTSSTNNSRIVGNQLLIEAREETIGSNNYTSARLLTKGKWDWTYGRFEARVKVPSGTGLWPAFWMLGADIDTVGWPNCGEIDIMEFVGRLPKEVFGTIHGPGYSAGASFGNTYTFVDDVSDDYHTFVVEWEEDLIKWYVDDILYHTAVPADVAPNDWVFDHDHFLILNLAIGGNFAGPLDPAVTFPKELWVDYVRVYEKDTSQPPGLLNPGFETSQLSPWIGFSAGGVNELGGYIESTSDTYYNGGNSGGDNVLTHSGQYVAKVFGDFSGSQNENGFYQEVAAIPGSIWDAEGWALTHPQDLMVGSNTTWLEVTFRDDSDNILGLFRSQVLTAGNVTPGTWMNLQINEELHPTTFVPLGTVTELVAPAGTTKARYQATFSQPAFDGGSIYLDDLILAEQSPPTPFDVEVIPGTMVNWTASDPASTYQPQESTDNINWADLGSPISGNSITSVFDEDGANYYQVIETAPPGLGNGFVNPSFETTEAAVHPSPGAPNWIIFAPEDTNPANGTASMTVESSYSTFSPRTGSQMLVLESTTPPAPAGVNAPNINVRSDFIAVDGSTSYDLSFYAAHVVKVGGANPQFNIRFYNNSMNEIGDTGYESFSSIGSSWTEVTKNFTTTSPTRWVRLEIIQAVGAGNDWQWVTLIDDASLPVNNAPGGQFTLPATGSPGVEISWDTETGWDYQVETSTGLNSYTPIGPVFLGDGNRGSLADEIIDPEQFYRVGKIEQP